MVNSFILMLLQSDKQAFVNDTDYVNYYFTEINCNIPTPTVTSTEGVTSNSPSTTDIAGTNHKTTKGTDMTSTIMKGTELTTTDHRTAITPSLSKCIQKVKADQSYR